MQPVDPANFRKDIWKNLAFVTRYGRIPLSEAEQLDRSDMTMFIEALGELIGKENTPED